VPSVGFPLKVSTVIVPPEPFDIVMDAACRVTVNFFGPGFPQSCTSSPAAPNVAPIRKTPPVEDRAPAGEITTVPRLAPAMSEPKSSGAAGSAAIAMDGGGPLQFCARPTAESAAQSR